MILRVKSAPRSIYGHQQIGISWDTVGNRETKRLSIGLDLVWFCTYFAKKNAGMLQGVSEKTLFKDF